MMENQVYYAKFIWLGFYGYFHPPRGRFRISVYIPKYPENRWDIFVYYNHEVEQYEVITAPIAPFRDDLISLEVGDIFIVNSLTREPHVNAIGLIERAEIHTEEEFFSILHLRDKYGTL